MSMLVGLCVGRNLWEKAFGVVWVGAVEIQILHVIISIDVNASRRFFLSQTSSQVMCFMEKT